MAANDPAPHRILVADDQPDVLEALRLLLKSEGYLIDTAKSPGSVMKAVEQRDYVIRGLPHRPGQVARLSDEGGRAARLRARDHRPELRARHHFRPGRPRTFG